MKIVFWNIGSLAAISHVVDIDRLTVRLATVSSFLYAPSNKKLIVSRSPDTCLPEARQAAIGTQYLF